MILVKDDPDFHNLIKVGDAINNLVCEFYNLRMYRAQSNEIETRQFRHAGFNLGGYVHETILLIDRIKVSYLGNPAFEPLRVLVVEPRYRRVQKFVRHVRNSLAFHMDSLADFTSATVMSLKPGNYKMFGWDGISKAHFYFEFSDYIAVANLLGKKPLQKPLRQTADELIAALEKYAGPLLDACITFHDYLWNKTAKDHVY
jgi:hypothetical protein